MIDVSKRGHYRHPAFAPAAIHSLSRSLRARVPDFDTAWDEVLRLHEPTSDWLEDVDGEEDSCTPIEFLKRACRAHYEYRIAQILGDPLDFKPPIYSIFVRGIDEQDEGPWETARNAPTPSNTTER